jgi:hypothetical protein
MYTDILHTLINALAGVLGTLAVAILTQLLRRANLNLSAQQEARVRYYAERAVHIVEETIAQKGPPKLARAVDLMSAQLPGLDQAAIVEAIHAELARQRADAANQLFVPKVDVAAR